MRRDSGFHLKTWRRTAAFAARAAAPPEFSANPAENPYPASGPLHQAPVYRFGPIEGFLFQMIKQTARRCDQNFDAAPQFTRLRFHIDAAKNGQAAQQRVLGISADISRNLIGEFARRRQ